MRKDVEFIKEKQEFQRLEIDAIGEKVEFIKNKVDVLEEKVEWVERYGRRNNVLLYGVAKDRNETLTNACKRLRIEDGVGAFSAQEQHANIPFHPHIEPDASDLSPQLTRSEVKHNLRKRFEDNRRSRSRAQSQTINDDPVTNDDNDGTIVELFQLKLLISKLACGQCKNTYPLSVFCSYCEETVNCLLCSLFTPSGVSGQKLFTVNKSTVFSCLTSGMGSHALRSFCENMDIPGLHHKSFQNVAQELYGQVPSLRKFTYHKTRQTNEIAHEQHVKERNIALTPSTIIDICVSYEGSWMTRGHTSYMGLGCLIDALTGLVIDHHVISTFCHTCATTGAWMKDQQCFDAWMEEHRRQGCDINFEDYESNGEPLPDESNDEGAADDNAGIWMNIIDNDPGSPPLAFTAAQGPKCCLPRDTDTHLQYFQLFVTDHLLEQIVVETNHYAKQWIDANQQYLLEHPRSRDHQSIKQGHSNLEEIKAFLSVVINMGMIRKPEIESYFETVYPSQHICNVHFKF
ncbi:hypothetical protein PoB_002971800 [Plakobranchus ocellatus]|uniref:Uncharacterized protein n=1 Tax=Plakobranchus ocellatus TaxID=259542 RepID=A0AAV4A8X4_9GAST|nr:hypothetical protein PoB_002971800 [Plakobranchus ocellatus]